MNVGGEYEYLRTEDLSFAVRLGMSNMIIGMEGKVGNLNEVAPANLKGAFGLGMRFKKVRIDFAWVQEIMRDPYSEFLVWTISWGSK
jgi:hypothetical protein